MTRNIMTELLFLRPQVKEKIWGGDELEKRFGYEGSGKRMGEAWLVSGHPEGVSIVEGGPFHGQRLDTLWEKHPEMFGNGDGRYGDRFPLLVKIIDAREDLSIQVHPDNAYAKVHEHGSLGKTECWYILDCKQGASIIIGHKAKDRQEMEEMIRQGRWKEFIREIPIKKGDFFQIPPGCLHAIKSGTLLLETQQSSDITYRVYDYGRLCEGKPRPLHLEKSMDVVTVPWKPETENRKIKREENVDKEYLQSCSYYTVERYDVHGIWEHDFHHGFTNVSVVEGEGKADGIPIRKGMSFIVPSGYGKCRLEGNFQVICSWPQKVNVSSHTGPGSGIWEGREQI